MELTAIFYPDITFMKLVNGNKTKMAALSDASIKYEIITYIDGNPEKAFRLSKERVYSSFFNYIPVNSLKDLQHFLPQSPLAVQFEAYLSKFHSAELEAYMTQQDTTEQACPKPQIVPYELRKGKE
jgi:hypothetical protein